MDYSWSDPLWAPAVSIDLDSISGVAFQAALKKFKDWSDSQPEEPLPELVNGWYDITPELAEKLLRRNKQNRKVALDVVRKYARRMRAGEWRRTGQPGILSGGELYDMQHRLLAGYFSNTTFPCYLILDVPAQDDLFAYIDDSKPRTPADALYTAGENGMSPMLAAAIKLAWRYDLGAISWWKRIVVRTMDNVEVLSYARENRGLGRACKDMVANYGSALKVIGDNAVAGVVAWKITELFGEEALGGFMTPLGSGVVDEISPVWALRTRLLKAEVIGEVLKTQHVLTLVTKAFGMHIEGQTIKTKRDFSARDNEEFLRFEDIAVKYQTSAAAD